MRAELDIPPGATVIGRHGGMDTFNLKICQEAVLQIADVRSDIYFVFMNTEKFSYENQEWEFRHNIIHCGRCCDPEQVDRFIRTCDAMIHCRKKGEAFGMAAAEFSMHNKPIFTQGVDMRDGQGAVVHDRLVAKGGDAARFIYRTKNELMHHLFNFHRRMPGDFSAYAAIVAKLGASRRG
jgi:hypothetical protein